MAVQVTKTWDERRLQRDRVQRLQQEMKKRGIGALYVTDTLNTRYVMNLKIPGGEVFVPVEGESVVFVRSRDLGYVKLKHSNVRPAIYQRNAVRAGLGEEEGNKLGRALADLMAEHGLKGQPLAVDKQNATTFMALSRADIRVTDALPLIEKAQSVKTPDEIGIYRSIGEQYAHTFTAFRDAIRPAISENELAAVVTSAWYEAGGEDIAQLNICAGENMNPWRRWPTQRALKAGELVGVDLHGRGISGLRGDGSRTFLVGDSPTAEQRKLYRQAYDYLWELTGMFRAGRAFSELIENAPRVPREFEKQLYNYNLGHGVGMFSSGYPHLDKHKGMPDGILEAGQVLAIECYFGEEGKPIAVKLEEQIVVRDGEPEILGPTVPFDQRLLR
jgi:Xaa-Pro aminopeptidase